MTVEPAAVEPMTVREATDFFAAFGNVAREPVRLARDVPTRGQLLDAARYAVQVNGQPAGTAARAVVALAMHFGIDL